ncbi:MAG: hypothetical protein AAF597_09200, partial [Bacteroidota bacterium]
VAVSLIIVTQLRGYSLTLLTGRKDVKGAPHAIGLNRDLCPDDSPFAALAWGLTHRYQNDDYQYIRGFRGQHIGRHVAKGEAGSDQRTANTFDG